MSARNYALLTIEEFGKQLIESNDLDPVYVALYTMLEGDILSQEHLNRWLLAYSCLYHCGAASYISEYEGYAFFDKLEAAARNERPAPTGERWPRAKERRHWRGQQAINSCQALIDRYGSKPENFITYLTWGNSEPHRNPAPFSRISARVHEHVGYGSWISFKLADMIDRLGLRKVEFHFDDVTIYRDPVLAAEMVARQKLGLPSEAQVKPALVRDVFEYLENHFSGYAAPPLYDRPIGLSEVETILCCWKSSQNGHYPPYNDIMEIHSGLAAWTEVSETASFFKAALPKLPREEYAIA